MVHSSYLFHHFHQNKSSLFSNLPAALLSPLLMPVISFYACACNKLAVTSLLMCDRLIPSKCSRIKEAGLQMLSCTLLTLLHLSCLLVHTCLMVTSQHV